MNSFQLNLSLKYTKLLLMIIIMILLVKCTCLTYSCRPVSRILNVSNLKKNKFDSISFLKKILVFNHVNAMQFKTIEGTWSRFWSNIVFFYFVVYNASIRHF